MKYGILKFYEYLKKNEIAKTQDNDNGILVIVDVQGEFDEYTPPHLLSIVNTGTDDTPSTFANNNSISPKFIVWLNVQLSILK